MGNSIGVRHLRNYPRLAKCCPPAGGTAATSACQGHAPEPMELLLIYSHGELIKGASETGTEGKSKP